MTLHNLHQSSELAAAFPTISRSLAERTNAAIMISRSLAERTNAAIMIGRSLAERTNAAIMIGTTLDMIRDAEAKLARINAAPDRDELDDKAARYEQQIAMAHRVLNDQLVITTGFDFAALAKGMGI